jgi:hypothetical protein
MITSPSDGVNPQNAYWSMSCDICGAEVERLQMRQGRMVYDRGQALTVTGEWVDIPTNYFTVCDKHEFNQETGEWEYPHHPLPTVAVAAVLHPQIIRLRQATTLILIIADAIEHLHPIMGSQAHLDTKIIVSDTWHALVTNVGLEEAMEMACDAGISPYILGQLTI